jgi:hypothetical protein
MQTKDKYKAIATGLPYDYKSATGKTIKGAVRRLSNLVPTHYGKNFPYTVYHIIDNTIAKEFNGK